MLIETDVIYVLIRGTALLSLVALSYGFVTDMGKAETSHGVAVGLVFGFASVLTMSDPFVLAPGVIIDARGIILVLAAPFGGLSAALVSGVIASIYRLWIGGAAAPLGVLVILAAVGTGYLCSRQVRKREGGYSLRQLLVLALFGSMQSFLLLLIPFFAPNVDPVPMLFPHVATNYIGIVLLGHFLSGIARRRHLTQMYQREALTDPLTGLPNRRAFDQAVENVERLRSGKNASSSLALLLIDIDHFKRVNDKWGHFFGDKVLRSVADTISRQVRLEDTVARYGGEEIAVILPARSRFDACKVAERIRLAIESANRQSNITVSIGVAADEDRVAFDEIFKAADRALYQAKENGRNRIELEYIEHAGPLPSLRAEKYRGRQKPISGRQSKIGAGSLIERTP